MSEHARQVSLCRQPPTSLHSPHSLPALSGSFSTSPTSPVTFAPTTQQLIGGMYELITEVTSDSPETGALNSSLVEKPVLDHLAVGLRSFYSSVGQGCANQGKSVYECSTVGLRSFSPTVSQGCSSNSSSFPMPTLETVRSNAGDAPDGALRFLSLNQLPIEFQDPVTTAEHHPAIPFGTTDTGILATERTADGNSLSWDDHELNFAMDMDMEMELDINMLGNR